MIGRKVEIPEKPMRVVSLVPSQTELLYYLGLGDKIVGQTVFCVHPEDQFKTAVKIGGTKKVKYDKIDELEPDLIICNKEENTEEIVDTLARKYPVWVSDIKTIEDACKMIEQIGHIFNIKESANQLSKSIQTSFTKSKIYRRFTCLYLIWRKPYMSVGNDTFIHHLLERAGFYNVLRHCTRYPELEEEAIMALNPELVFLSDEPYPFAEKHIKEIQDLLPNAKIVLVNGELFSWYGNRLLNSQSYFNELQRRIHKGIN